MTLAGSTSGANDWGGMIAYSAPVGAGVRPPAFTTGPNNWFGLLEKSSMQLNQINVQGSKIVVTGNNGRLVTFENGLLGGFVDRRASTSPNMAVLRFAGGFWAGFGGSEILTAGADTGLLPTITTPGMNTYILGRSF